MAPNLKFIPRLKSLESIFFTSKFPANFLHIKLSLPIAIESKTIWMLIARIHF